jgi:hypothetical protein
MDSERQHWEGIMMVGSGGPPGVLPSLLSYRARRARTEGTGANDFRVYAHDPYHVAAAVP